jgi:hypothetical protein
LDRDGPLAAEVIARTDPWLGVGLGGPVVGGAAYPVEDRRQGNVLRRIVHAPGRDLVSTYTTTAQTTALTEALCKSMEDIEALLAIPYVASHPVVECFLDYKKQVGQDGLAYATVDNGLCFPYDVLGPQYCNLLWAMEPEVIREMVALAAGRAYRFAEEACRGGVDCIRIIGGEYATELMGPRAWEELIVPFDGPLVEMIHSYGAIAHYHNHGHMRRVIEQIADLGIDSLDPVEQPPYGDLEMDEAMARIGDRVCPLGGLDDMEILETRPWAEIEPMAVDLLERVGTTGWMLGGTSSATWADAAARNFIALVEVAERYA